MEISLMCNRSNAMTFIRVKVMINFTLRAHQLWQLCGNLRSKAARTPPTASPFRGKGAEIAMPRSESAEFVIILSSDSSYSGDRSH